MVSVYYEDIVEEQHKKPNRESKFSWKLSWGCNNHSNS